LLTTTAGDLDLRIPEAAYRLVLPQPAGTAARVDQALFAVVMEATLCAVRRNP